MIKMRWSTRKRLEFIESRLFWDGKISRKDLTDFFDVSVPQATKDLKMYSELAPENIHYDNRAKHYEAGTNFKPEFSSLDSETYFSHLAVSNAEKNDVFFCGTIPESYQMPLLARPVSPSILKNILECMHDGYSIEIEYQSMNSPDPTKRWISPHAISTDGLRWHVRALCHNDKKYKDFVFGRIISTGDKKKFPFSHENDFLWHNNITFRIAPHHDLSVNQRKIIECDYNMTDGEVSIQIKASSHFYLKHRLGLNKNNEDHPGKEQHIVLLNRDEVETKISLLEEIEKSKILELFQKSI